MSLPQEYIEELNALNKKIAQDKPKDIIEYCAAYFSNKLSSRRSTGGQSSGAPMFKSPFASSDPHAILSEDPHSSPNYFPDQGKGKSNENQEPSALLFKNSFSVDSRIPLVSDVSQYEDEDKSTPLPSESNTKFATPSIPSTFNAFRRSSVSAETLNPNSFQNDDWKPPYHELSDAQVSRLNKSIVRNFLFSNLEDDALKTVLHALQEKSFSKDSTVIKQGDEGDFFYLIEKGEVEFYVNGDKVSSAGPGASFGELALMYNSPRAATVKAKTDLILWALDRLTFRRILLEVTAKKRLMYEEFLKDVKILSDLSSYQRSKLADALHTEVYQPNDTIIAEGFQ